MVNAEAHRLHMVHCMGCPEYGKHGGERTKPSLTVIEYEGEANEGFDSPPPPPNHKFVESGNPDLDWCVCGLDHISPVHHEHTISCYDC